MLTIFPPYTFYSRQNIHVNLFSGCAYLIVSSCWFLHCAQFWLPFFFWKNIFHPNKHVIAPKAIKLCVHYCYGIVCYYFAFTILRDDLLSGWRRSPGAISLFANDLSTVISGIYCGIWALLLALCSRSWKQIPTIIWRKNDYHLRVTIWPEQRHSGILLCKLSLNNIVVVQI